VAKLPQKWGTSHFFQKEVMLNKLARQAWSNLETANESETRLVRSRTACPIFNELV